MLDRMIANAEQKQRSYAGLAAAYASSGEGWLSAHAQVSSDVCAGEALLWSQGRVDDVVSYRDKGRTLLSGSAMTMGRVSEVVTQVRDELARALDEETDAAWRERLLPLDRLETGGVMYADQARAVRERRLGGEDEFAFVLRRRAEQSQYALQAQAQQQAGDLWPAVESIYAADLAGYECWLVQRSIALGDVNLIQAELRWALGVAALEQIHEFPPEPHAAAFVVRSRLAWVAGFEEVASLASAFTHVSR